MSECPDCSHSRAEHHSWGCGVCGCWNTRTKLIARGIVEGERRRDDGIAHVIESTASDEWRDLAYRWMSDRPIGSEFTSTDLVDAIGIPPSPNAVGAVVRATATRGTIRNTGRYVKSARPSCHAAVVAVWERVP